MNANVLVADSREPDRMACAGVLRGLGIKTQLAESGARALELLETGRFEVVLVEARLAGPGGVGLLRLIRKRYPGLEVVVIAETGSATEAGEALRLGAYGCVTRPFRASEVGHLLERLAEKQGLAAENRWLREQARAREGFADMIGASAKMQQVYRTVLKVAERRHPVLILGETGTGKELVAGAIHAQGPWSDKPFVPVDCGALTPTLIESELFGHLRGAFTGATEGRQGLLAAAGGGTVFLDEIAELPLELQAKLLRAIQEREFRPLGSNAHQRLEARLVAATNQDPQAAVRQGTLRKDLYFRLNVVTLRLPPLRERRSDIPALIHSFIDRHQGEQGGFTGVSDDAMTRLMSYDWPGNVRELENCIQRALTLGTPPTIQVENLPTSLINFQSNTPGNQTFATLKELERRAILQALEIAGGDRVRAAKLLGIGKTTIYRKIREYGLEGAQPAPD